MNTDALAKQWHQCIRPDVNRRKLKYFEQTKILSY